MKKLAILLLTSTLLFASNLAFAEAVNINTADAPTLVANIKGIGLKKAESIVAYREQHGAFAHVEDLAKVRGIGKKTVTKNLENLKID